MFLSCCCRGLWHCNLAHLKLADRDRELTETRREVNNVIEKKKRLELELERLKEHLLAVEEGYTQEALATEQRERELRKKLQVSISLYSDYFLFGLLSIRITLYSDYSIFGLLYIRIILSIRITSIRITFYSDYSIFGLLYIRITFYSDFFLFGLLSNSDYFLFGLLYNRNTR